MNAHYLNSLVGWLDRSTPRVYVAKLTQSATGAPTAVVAKNNTRTTVTFATTASAGKFTGVFSASIMPVASKAIAFIDVNFQSGTTSLSRSAKVTINDKSKFTIRTYSDKNTLANSMLSSTPFEIRIYK